MGMSAAGSSRPLVAPEAASARLHSRVRALFIVTILLWGVQFVFHELISEPWPSLTFPRFARVGGDYASVPTHYALGEVVLHASDGATVHATPEELFGSIEYTQSTIMNRQFSPKRAMSEEDTLEGGGLLRRIHAWPSARLEELLGDVPPFTRYYEGRDGQPRGNTPESREWLNGLIEEWSPGSHFESADFVWYQYKGFAWGHDLDTLPLTKETYHVSLR